MRSSPEQEWDDEQAAWMIALAQLEAETCKGCGGNMLETTALDPWDGERKEYVHTYKVEEPHRCRRCTAVAAAQEALPKDTKHPHALMFGVTDIPPNP